MPEKVFWFYNSSSTVMCRKCWLINGRNWRKHPSKRWLRFKFEYLLWTPQHQFLNPSSEDSDILITDMEEMYHIYWPNLSNHEVNVGTTVWRKSLNTFCHISFIDRKKHFSLLDCLYRKVILRENLVRTGGMEHRDREPGLLGFIHSSDTLFICCMTLASLFSWPASVVPLTFLCACFSLVSCNELTMVFWYFSSMCCEGQSYFWEIAIKKKNKTLLSLGQINDLKKIVFYLLEC